MASARLKTIGALALLPSALNACGDDLEDRNQAAGVENTGGEIRIERPGRADDAASLPRSAPTTSIESPEDSEDLPVVDARPEDLVDTTRGFDTNPVDDASGFDPSPQVEPVQ